VKSFKFTLEPVLRWRTAELAAEQEKLQRLMAAHHRLEEDLRALAAARRGAVRTGLDSQVLSGFDFRSVAAYLVGLDAQHARLQLALKQSTEDLQRQQAVCLQLERRTELLETLKSKRQDFWQREADLQLETLAAESHLARRARDRRA
jgi:flagellar biosynthesis chaperone FliJ